MQLENSDRKSFLSNLVDSDFDTTFKVEEEQKTFSYIRVYLPEEYEIENGDNITLTWTTKEESFNLTFTSYGKANFVKDGSEDDEIKNYVKEDDKKELILAYELSYINSTRSLKHKNIRTLFRNSYFFENNFLMKSELILTHNGNEIKYNSIDF